MYGRERINNTRKPIELLKIVPRRVLARAHERAANSTTAFVGQLEPKSRFRGMDFTNAVALGERRLVISMIQLMLLIAVASRLQSTTAD